MSQYFVLITSVDTLDIIPGTPDYVYALTTSNQPTTGLSLLQNYCPIKLALVHSVRSASRTNDLLRTLEIKYQSKHLHSFWYILESADVAFIKSLNETNFNSMIGFIQRQLKKPDMDQEQLERFVSEQLQKAERAL